MTNLPRLLEHTVTQVFVGTHYHDDEALSSVTRSVFVLRGELRRVCLALAADLLRLQVLDLSVVLPALSANRNAFALTTLFARSIILILVGPVVRLVYLSSNEHSPALPPQASIPSHDATDLSRIRLVGMLSARKKDQLHGRTGPGMDGRSGDSTKKLEHRDW